MNRLMPSFPAALVAVPALVVLLVGCSSTGGARRAGGTASTSTSTTTSTATSAVTAARPTSTSAATGPGRDIRASDWANASYPGSVCGGSGTVHLLNGYGYVSSSRWRDAWRGNDPPRMASQVEVRFDGPVQYGDLDGDGRPEAVVPIWCTNGGGTAAGQLGQSLVVFSGFPGALAVTGIIGTSQPATNGATYFDNSATRIERGRITVVEIFYGPKDSTCCPTGRAQATWTLYGTTLTRTATQITKPPAQ